MINRTGTDLRRAWLTGAKVDGTTFWPPGFDWNSAGVIMEDTALLRHGPESTVSDSDRSRGRRSR